MLEINSHVEQIRERLLVFMKNYTKQSTDLNVKSLATVYSLSYELAKIEERISELEKKLMK